VSSIDLMHHSQRQHLIARLRELRRRLLRNRQRTDEVLRGLDQGVFYGLRRSF